MVSTISKPIGVGFLILTVDLIVIYKIMHILHLQGHCTPPTSRVSIARFKVRIVLVYKTAVFVVGVKIKRNKIK